MIKDAEAPPTILLSEYEAPFFEANTVDLHFDLEPERTRVTSTVHYRRVRDGNNTLVLDGERIELIDVAIDDKVLEKDQYELDESTLRIKNAPDDFVLRIRGDINPKANTSLSGLYVSQGMFCTQCEAQGFRRITYFQDRPDVMATFKTTITGDKSLYPVMLSNGNLIDEKAGDDGKHTVTWEDPFRKPAYLFALVAGGLSNIEDTFTTKSGRKVTLKIFCREEDINKTDHAMVSLKNSMKWDEDVYGLEYDLDIFMIVAVSDFNFGAMENKGLNIFNTRYVLARPETATDHDFAGIEGVVGHEYFHNWSGNRVTCRDWFQLSLKEGLTVFRDQEFSADMGSRAVKRIEDVARLRSAQFPEDAGPTAHPIRPDKYVEINNFYTATVYEKGAEVVRMIHTLVGPEGFRKGTDLYFERHDGQAVTCDDFVQAMQDASGRDLSAFRTWYSQAGTPHVKVQQQYDAEAKTLTLEISQHTEPTPGQVHKDALVIPLRTALLSEQGQEQSATLEGKPLDVIELSQASKSFVLEGVNEPPVLSIARGFSAPIKLHVQEPGEHVAIRMAHDTDAFNRYEAAQVYERQVILDVALEKSDVPQAFLDACLTLLSDDETDPALIAKALTFPSVGELAQHVTTFEPLKLHEGRQKVMQAFAHFAKDLLLKRYQENAQSGEYVYSPKACGKRALRNRALSFLSLIDDDASLAKAHYEGATNMSDWVAALASLSGKSDAVRTQAFDDFYERYKHDALVTDKWFALQAISTRSDTPERVLALLEHKDFDIKNPNRVRALLSNFCSGNPVGFHREDGVGYRILGEAVARLDAINPAVAARLLIPLTRHKQLDAGRKAMMLKELERFSDAQKTSRDVFEIASKGLA